MRRNIICVLSVVAVVSSVSVSAVQAGDHSTGILVVDLQAVYQKSKVGQDVERQLLQFQQSLQSEFGPPAAAMQKEDQALQQKLATAAPDVREKATNAFQARQAAFRQKVQARESMLQGGDMQAREQVKEALSPIFQQILRERGADVIVAKGGVIESVKSADVTALAIQRLDQKLPKLKVQFVSSPGTPMLAAPGTLR